MEAYLVLALNASAACMSNSYLSKSNRELSANSQPFMTDGHIVYEASFEYVSLSLCPEKPFNNKINLITAPSDVVCVTARIIV